MVSIDFEGANQRIVAFPLPSQDYWGLQAVEDGAVYFDEGGMQRYNVKEQKNELIMADIETGIVSADGKKFIYRSRGDYGVTSLAPNQKAGDGKLNLDNLTMRIEPRKEWNQIFVDGWRIFRDFFYVDNLHNVDWNGFRQKYSELLPYLNHRFDLDYIFGEIIAETNTGHSYADWGDFERVQRLETGLLGAKLKGDPANNATLSRKYFRRKLNPERRSPLTEQGILDIAEGEYLIAIEGTDITTDDNPYRFLENRVNVATRITVNSKPTAVGARTYTIRPIASEIGFRCTRLGEYPSCHGG